MLQDLLKEKHCFKFVCGAGNEDIENICRFVYLYALAGCRFFDICSSSEVVDAVIKVLHRAHIYDAYLCVSVGIKGDPHCNKAVINYNKCINCGSCESVCPQSAIHYAKVKKEKCIGCSRCSKVCPRNAISFTSEEKNINEVLPQIVKKGIDCIEFHVDGRDENEIFAKWKYIADNFDGMLSICISRNKLGDDAFIERIRKMIEGRKPYTTIIQADGFPMSGGEDNYKTTLQAIAAAEIVQNANLPVYLMLSGGTNSNTAKLAKMCDIDFNAIAVGSYARKIVKKYVERSDFWSNQSVIEEALDVIKPLIDSVIL